MIELTDRARWVPSEGEGWDAPIVSVHVASRRAFLGLMFDGLELEVPGVGEVRVRAMNFAPSVPLAPTDRVTGDARATGRLRKELLARGAVDASEEAGKVELDAYRSLADGYASVAARLRAIATEAEGYAALAPASHDMTFMTRPEPLSAFEDVVAARRGLRTLLEQAAASEEAMLAQMRAAQAK